MDVLKYGPDVEAVEPPELRAEVAGRLAAALANYPEKTILPHITQMNANEQVD
jgi:hypothetical protein